VLVDALFLCCAQSVYSALMQALGATDRILEVFDHVPPEQLGSKRLSHLDGRIEFRDVTFSYPTRPDAAIFKGLNLVVPAGKVVAILGGSGSGKSTLIALLTRLYEPQRGEVTLDGVGLAELDLTWLREHIGSVTQDATIFQGSIRDNIRFGDLDASEAAVEEAARQANAYDFVTGFPDGFETVVGERGALLSGGQKQRICIARAILKNPRVLVLDEATSALDVESERLVQQALERLMQDRTTMVITHRLSTVKNADFIAVIEDGRVIEFGTRDEVLKIDGGRFNAYLQQTKLGTQA
jgi:ABC-type multidrug transport system fused ATPase/permease subunit